MSLFRREVLEQKLPKHVGSVVVPFKLSYLTMGIAALIFLLTILLITKLGSVKKTEKAIGVISPASGIIKVYPAESGVVLKSFLVESGEIKKGELLVTISKEKTNSAGESYSKAAIGSYQQTLSLLDKELKIVIKQYETDIEELKSQRSLISIEIDSTQKRINLQKFIVELSRTTLEKLESLVSKGTISSLEYDSKKLSLMQAEQYLEQLKLTLSTAQSRYNDSINSVQNVQNTFERNKDVVELKRVTAKEKITRFNATQSFSVVAQMDGKVASVNAYKGQRVTPNHPIATILQKGGDIVAELYLPTKSIAFVEEGQEVILAFKAFPKNKYGTLVGHISSITKTVLMPNDIESQIPIDGPIYRVYATLKTTSMQTKNGEVPLQIGMQIDATIVIEIMNISDWLFAPLKNIGKS